MSKRGILKAPPEIDTNIRKRKKIVREATQAKVVCKAARAVSKIKDEILEVVTADGGERRQAKEKHEGAVQMAPMQAKMKVTERATRARSAQKEDVSSAAGQFRNGDSVR